MRARLAALGGLAHPNRRPGHRLASAEPQAPPARTNRLRIPPSTYLLLLRLSFKVGSCEWEEVCLQLKITYSVCMCVYVRARAKKRYLVVGFRVPISYLSVCPYIVYGIYTLPVYLHRSAASSSPTCPSLLVVIAAMPLSLPSPLQTLTKREKGI